MMKVNMESLLQDEILHMGLILMTFIGEHLHYTSRKLFIFRLFNCTVVVLLLIFTTANFLHADIHIYVKNVQSLISIFHMLFKYLLFIYYKSDIEQLMEDRLRFWSYKNFDGNVIIRTKKVYNVINFIQVFALTVSTIAVIMYFLKPAFNSDVIYLIDTWVFNNSRVLDTIVLACQYYFFVIILAIVIGYDSIYLSLCAHVVLQVRLLKYKIKYLSEIYSNQVEREISSCIRHHQLLISVFKRMKRVYSLMLLFHYFVTLATCCIDLYELLVGKSDISYMVIMVISLLFLYGQFGYYTIPADAVASEFSDFSNSIYMSKWHKYNTTVQKLLLLMMVKSQRQEYFSGGGMIEINIYTYGSVVRKTFSFYAILRTLFSK